MESSLLEQLATPAVSTSRGAGCLPIALVGCGGIAKHHLEGYRDRGLQVVAFCDPDRAAAERLRDQFFPEASLYPQIDSLLRDCDAPVLDIATHPEPRVSLIEKALQARRHVLSQKPFVLDVAMGQRLCDLAERNGTRLFVNQNGRFAPHYQCLRRAIAMGLLGVTHAAHLAVHWDHSWTAGTKFAEIRHLILYDFAIHWFDIVRCFLSDQEPIRVYASVRKVPGQPIEPALAAQVAIEFEHAQATMVFDAFTRHGQQDRTIIIGDRGTASSWGPDLQDQQVRIDTAAGSLLPKLRGQWFSDGFGETMLEAQQAIAEPRPSLIDARDNLKSLALCFAAIASAESGQPQSPSEAKST